jgi:hypothetical protein
VVDFSVFSISAFQLFSSAFLSCFHFSARRWLAIPLTFTPASDKLPVMKTLLQPVLSCFRSMRAGASSKAMFCHVILRQGVPGKRAGVDPEIYRDR